MRSNRGLSGFVGSGYMAITQTRSERQVFKSYPYPNPGLQHPKSLPAKRLRPGLIVMDDITD